MTTPNTRETDPKPEVSGGGGAGGFIPMLRAAAMSDRQLGQALLNVYLSANTANAGHDEMGRIARNLLTPEPAPSSLPAGLVVRPHRVVAGGWGSEPAWEHYVRYDFGGISKPCPPDLWPTHRDDALCTGWCHAYDFQRAMRNNTPVPWVTRTAPRVEWLPWTQGRPGGQWWVLDSDGEGWRESGPCRDMTPTNTVAYWPYYPGLDLTTLTAAILAGDLTP